MMKTLKNGHCHKNRYFLMYRYFTINTEKE